jgi:uncharacterized membrane protein
MASYRARLERDLDRWIADGLVPVASRAAILSEAHEPRRLDAAAALALVGAMLLGAAIIAFVAANWDGMPRALRFGLVLLAFLTSVGAAAEAARRGRSQATNALLALAALIFAAALGLTGQIFEIMGDPQATLWTAGVVAGLLALAGRSSAAAVTALALIAAGDIARTDWNPGGGLMSVPLLVLVAPLGVVAAWRWRSTPLAHVAALGWIVGLLHLALDGGEDIQLRSWMLCGVLAVLAAAARLRFATGGTPPRLFYGWAVLGALTFLGLAGAGEASAGLTFMHRTLWLAASLGVIVLGRADRHGFSTTVGVISLLGAILAVLLDLGLGLMAAAGLFTGFAVVTLALSWMLRGRSSAAHP